MNFNSEFMEVAAAVQAPAEQVNDNTIEGAFAAIAQRRAAEAEPAVATPAPDTPAPAAVVEQPTPEAPAPAAATPAPQAATPAAEPATPQQTDWREAIKGVDIAELLQLKGVDEKVVKLFDKYNKDGDLSEYFKAYSTDYDKLPDTEMLRLKINDKYAAFSDEEKAEMYEAELEKYHLDAEAYDEKEVRRAKIALKADLADARTAFKAKQQDSLIPTKDVAADAAAAKAAQEKALQQYADDFSASEAFKKAAANKFVTIGEGEMAFNMDVDLDYAKSYATDEKTYIAAHMGADGKPDYQKQILSSAFNRDPKAFIAKIFDHAGKVQKKSLISELGNEQPPAANAVIDTPDLTPAQRAYNGGNIRW